MLLLLILPLWALGLALVAGLCFAARLGDGEQAGYAAQVVEQAHAQLDVRRISSPAAAAERVAPARREIAV